MVIGAYSRFSQPFVGTIVLHAWSTPAVVAGSICAPLLRTISATISRAKSFRVASFSLFMSLSFRLGPAQELVELVVEVGLASRLRGGRCCGHGRVASAAFGPGRTLDMRPMNASSTARGLAAEAGGAASAATWGCTATCGCAVASPSGSGSA
ncbi:MAG: hypothetical protein IPN05_08580 [Sulfuritalea sp.]|nr:hypothetical protein [Sulfuritalea sp.]